jgi:DNA-binding transcriptional ArsR family regulator
MGKLCSIFHLRFKNLITVISSTRKAQLVDYILFGWQTSTYKLKGSDQKWFMKPYTQIVEDTGIPKSTLERYLKELNEEGLIERRQALYSRTTEQGNFEVKKGAYIHITDKLLTLLKEPLSSKKPSITIPEKKEATHKENMQEETKKQTTYSHIEKNEGFETLKMRGLYIRDLYTSFNNTITFRKFCPSVDNITLQFLVKQFESIQKFISSGIKEEIPEEIKRLALGTLFNLTFKHQKRFSSPKQIAAEYLYALVNKVFYLPRIQSFNHRNNILAKLLRNNHWRTPKGFYKHFYLGPAFKDKQHIHEQQWQACKQAEIKGDKEEIQEEKNIQLLEIEAQIYEKSTSIEKLTKHLYQQSNEEAIHGIREKIILQRKELQSLWDRQYLIEQGLEPNNSITLDACA